MVGLALGQQALVLCAVGFRVQWGSVCNGVLCAVGVGVQWGSVCISYLHVCAVGDPLGQLLRSKADPLEIEGVCALGLPFGREVHEGGSAVHVELGEGGREGEGERELLVIKKYYLKCRDPEAIEGIEYQTKAK